MNPKCLVGCKTTEKLTLKELMEDIEQIRSDIDYCSLLGLSAETLEKINKELELQKNELKEKMHNLIDEL